MDELFFEYLREYNDLRGGGFTLNLSADGDVDIIRLKQIGPNTEVVWKDILGNLAEGEAGQNFIKLLLEYRNINKLNHAAALKALYGED